LPVALYHLHVKNISRSEGRSAVAAAAYRAGETLPNEREEGESAFGGKRDVVFTRIFAPAVAPDWVMDRAALWNTVEAAEKRKDARLAKEIEFALPHELPRREWRVVAGRMADAYVLRGHVVDLAIHEDGSGRNPHIHMMLTTRALTAEGFGGKMREADGRAFVQDARVLWESIANEALAEAGSEVMIDSRSHAERGLEQRPGRHNGADRGARLAKRIQGAKMAVGPEQDLREAWSDVITDKDVREKFPLLSARPDWPPEERAAAGMLSSPERAEEQLFWKEVQRRAFGDPEKVHEAERGDEPHIGGQVDAIYESVREAEGKSGSERQAAFAAAAPLFRDMQERLVREMIRAGILSEKVAERWGDIETAMRSDAFDRMLVEARAIEAKRREPGHWPEATESQRAQVAEIEEKERWEKAVAFTPSIPDRDLPVPDPDGRPISIDALERAEEAMLKEMESGQQIEIPKPEVASSEERDQAQEAVLRVGELPVSNREALAYRMAPQENRLDWLEDRMDQNSWEEVSNDRTRRIRE